MGELFGRSYVLEVQDETRLTTQIVSLLGFKIDSEIKPSLDIDFTVVRTKTREPNTAAITIYNLSDDNRSHIETMENAKVILQAGYQGDNGMIFKGDVEASNLYEFPDWRAELEADDGGRAVRLDRINVTFAPGTSLATVIKKTAEKMRVNIGNTAMAALRGELVDGGKEFINGVTLSGSVAKQLNRLTKSSGHEWSIQNDTLQLLKLGEPMPVSAVLLSPETGLVGVPSINNKGVITIRSLLNHNIYPGCIVSLKTKTLNGQYIVHKCTYTGQTAGDNWYVDMEGKAY